MHPGAHNWSWGLALGLGVLSVGMPVNASPEAPSVRPVLVAPVVGSPSVTNVERSRTRDAVRRALEAKGYRVAVGQESLGQAVIECRTPECIERSLDTAGAEFAVVPALWKRAADETELTLTLIQREGHAVNAGGAIDADEEASVEAVIGELLTHRATGLAPRQDLEEPAPEPKHPNAWLAGPILLLASGTAAFVAIGVGAATKGDTQQLRTAAVAAWSIVGATALAGGVAWWVVGARRRGASPRALRRSPTVMLHPTRIDLRLRF